MRAGSVPSVSDDWSYQLAQAFLVAALSCDAECGRVFVADSCSVESPPPGCDCQLVAVVNEGWEPDGPCGVRAVAEVRLVLDLCTTVAGPDEVPDPVAVNTRAQAHAALRWAIMRGLRQGWLDGTLCGGDSDVPAALSGCCGRIRPGVWRCVGSGGGSVRWETVWRYEDDSL